MTAFSDSSNITISPLDSLSLSEVTHNVIFPSIMVELSTGMKISGIYTWIRVAPLLWWRPRTWKPRDFSRHTTIAVLPMP
jgi:hypothetical protein